MRRFMIRSLLQRLNVYGDFWLRYLFYGARICPWFMEPVIISSFAALFFLTCGGNRRAVVSNLAVIRPQDSWWMRRWNAFRVFLNFAWTQADLALVRLGRDVIDWEIYGDDNMNDLATPGVKALILTAHMGNYDVAASLLAERVRRRIHIVRVPERVRNSQEYIHQRRYEADSGRYVVHYNEKGNMLAVELARVLGDGEIVAIQGDRVLFDVSLVDLAYEPGIRWKVPRGPFLLAQVARAPVYPIFIVRLGWRRYAIEAGAPFVWNGEARDRAGAERALSEWWNEILADTVRRHWYQWFVFEPAFSSAGASDGGEAGS